MPTPPVVLSLFDHTGEWSRHYADAGCEVIPIDLQNEGDLGDIGKFSVQRIIEDLGIDDVDGILAATPCTEFTKSGAAHWKAKDADGRTAAAVHLARQALRTVEYFQPNWWGLENPEGRIQKLVPELLGPTISKFTFDPCDFAGYVDNTKQDLERMQVLRDKERLGLRFDREEIEFIKAKNLYTKRTVIWGQFTFPEPKRLEPISVCEQGSWLQLLGGKSDKTKNERSATPEGFARAFTLANSFNPEALELGQLRRAARYVLRLEMSDERHIRREIEDEFGIVDDRASKVLEMVRDGDRGRVDATPITRRTRVRV